MATSDNLIVTAGLGYSPDQLGPFLKSARQHVPKADVVIFSHTTDEKYKNHIADLNGRARVVVADGYQFKDYLWKFQKLRRFVKSTGLGKLPKYFSGVLGKQNSLVHKNSLLHVQIARYIWINAFLRELDAKPDMVLLTDSRDVFFQGDPFEGGQDRIMCGEEPMNIGDCPTNAGWIESSYSKALLGDIGACPVLCSGVTLGNFTNVAAYAEAMVSDIQENALKLVGRLGNDQGIHNKILHKDRRVSFTTSRNGDELIATLHNSDLGEFSFSETQGLLTKDQRPVKIVHQYDRHERLRDWVNKTY